MQKSRRETRENYRGLRNKKSINLYYLKVCWTAISAAAFQFILEKPLIFLFYYFLTLFLTFKSLNL